MHFLEPFTRFGEVPAQDEEEHCHRDVKEIQHFNLS
jgi:hypothetical protein